MSEGAAARRQGLATRKGGLQVLQSAVGAHPGSRVPDVVPVDVPISALLMATTVAPQPVHPTTGVLFIDDPGGRAHRAHDAEHHAQRCGAILLIRRAHLLPHLPADLPLVLQRRAGLKRGKEAKVGSVLGALPEAGAC